MTKKKKTTQLDRIENAGNRPESQHSDGSQLDRIERAIYGNGREGLQGRAARIEEHIEFITENSKRNSEGISQLLQATAALKFSVDTHHAAFHLNAMLPKPKFWMAICGAFVVMHLISTYVPNVFNFVMALRGAPTIKLPLS